VSLDCLLDSHRRADRLGGARERRHDAVPDAHGDRPVVGRHRLGQQPVVRAPEVLRRLLAHVRALRGRADEVGEENGRGAGVRRGRLGGHPVGIYCFCALSAKDRCPAGG
jgi:hypothetical protein